MPIVYPGAIDSLPDPAAADTLAEVPHDGLHRDTNAAVEAVETKLGTGASTPTTAGHVLKVTGPGATAYGAINAADIEGAIGSIYLNVADYGATGDGVTNDTAAIQAAINAAADNETVFFPSGRYIITASLTIPEGVRLLGAGSNPNWFNQSTIIEMTTASVDAITAGTYMKDLGVENLTLLGPGSGTGRGIYSSSSVHMRGVHVEGFYDGVYLDASLGEPPSSVFYNHIDQCWFMSNQRAGLLLHTKTNNTTVSDTYFASADYGILADGGAYGLRILSSSFEVHGVTGISIDGTGAAQNTSGVLISGCYFEQLPAGGIPTSDIKIGPTTEVQGVLIEGCYFVYTTVAGLWHIDLDRVNGVTISGNHIGSGTEAGAVRGTVNTLNLTLLTNYAPGSFSVPASTIILSNLLSGTAHDARDHAAVTGVLSPGSHDGRDHTGVPGVAGGPGSVTGSGRAKESSTIALTTSAADITGASLSITPTMTETWLVWAMYDFSWTAANAGNIAVGSISFSGAGTMAASDATFQGDVVGRATVTAFARITGVTAAAHTVKLQALKTGAGGTAGTSGTSSIMVLRYAE